MPLEGEYEPSTWKMAADQVELFESTNGAEGQYQNDAFCIILTNRGAKSGKIRKSPLIRVTDGTNYAAVGSMGGAPKSPNWVTNLTADPHVELQDGPVRRDYTARLVDGDERARWWAIATEAWPAYDDYQAKTERVIPVFVLEPRAEA
ncbi:MAG: nitroreductase family deazaflavin-dependent oxidoreductase [Aquihabitans sp.]